MAVDDTTEATPTEATRDLRAEHRGVLRMLSILEGMSGGLRQGKLPPREHQEEVVDFLRVFVDRCHHHKEEILLFPALQSATGPETVGLIAELLDEHVAGRRRVSALDAGLIGATPQDGPALAGALESYVSLLRAHIEKEETRLFPIADSVLPKAAADRLAAGYDRVEEEVIGPGRHEAFHVMLDTLSAVYRV